MAWKWSGEGRRNIIRRLISQGVKRAVWRCKSCGRGQVGGRFEPKWPKTGISRVWICRYCKTEHSSFCHEP